jgi:hypothetical protein
MRHFTSPSLPITGYLVGSMIYNDFVPCPGCGVGAEDLAFGGWFLPAM